MGTPTKEETIAALTAAGFQCEELPQESHELAVIQVQEGVKVHLNWRSGVANCFSAVPRTPGSGPTPSRKSPRELVHEGAANVLQAIGWRMNIHLKSS